MIKNIVKLVNMVTELGGNMYDVAVDAGLLSAHRFMQKYVDEQSYALAEDVKAVTEVYVSFGDTEELDRIFMYSDDAQLDLQLWEEGCIAGGRFVIAYDKLKDLAGKGYKCLYHRCEDGHNGKAFARYNAAFGENRTMLPFRMWDSSAYFVGKGNNRAFLVTTKFERLFVMPDIHTVSESVRLFYAENLIREKYDSTFRIERICMEDEKVLETLRTSECAIVGREGVTDDDKLPESYRKLYYQIAYIMTYYPDVYKEALCDAQEPGAEQKDLNTEVSVGIFLNHLKSYGVCGMPDGTIQRIVNSDCPPDTPINLQYKFDGYGIISETDTVIAKMADIMKNVVSCASAVYTVGKVYVTIDENSMSVDEEGNNRNICETELIEAAAQAVGIPDMQYVDYFTACMQAYDKNAAVSGMQVNDIALLYDLKDSGLLLALIRRVSGNEFQVIGSKELYFPEYFLFEWDEDFSYVYEDTFQPVYEDEFGDQEIPGLYELVWSDVDHFMLDAGLRVLGINNSREADRIALENIRADCDRMKRQFARNDTAKIVFDNGYLRITEDYPISRFAECYNRVLRRCDGCLRDLLESAAIATDDISVVVMAGAKSEYPFVQEHLKQFTGKPVCTVNALECAAARGAVSAS